MRSSAPSGRSRGPRSSPPRLRVALDGADRRTAAVLRRAALHAAAAEGYRSGELSLAVVDARAMSALHHAYLGHRGPTDVLSFDLGTDSASARLEGEVVVCVDVARTTAAARGEPAPGAVRAELALYVVHGVLHLCGYDDHAPADFRRMHRREDELLTQLGLGRVFDQAAPNPSGSSRSRAPRQGR